MLFSRREVMTVREENILNLSSGESYSADLLFKMSKVFCPLFKVEDLSHNEVEP